MLSDLISNQSNHFLQEYKRIYKIDFTEQEDSEALKLSNDIFRLIYILSTQENVINSDFKDVLSTPWTAKIAEFGKQILLSFELGDISESLAYRQEILDSITKYLLARTIPEEI